MVVDPHSRPVHMDSGRKRLANGMEMRRHSQSLEKLTIICMSAISGHTVLTAERFSSCSGRQATPFSGPSPGSGNQLPLPTNFPCQPSCNVFALACSWHHFDQLGELYCTGA